MKITYKGKEITEEKAIEYLGAWEFGLMKERAYDKFSLGVEKVAVRYGITFVNED